jgi:hypothetical protein
MKRLARLKLKYRRGASIALIEKNNHPHREILIE